MATLDEIRAQYPQYKDVPDQALADRVHETWYKDVPKEAVYQRLGYSPQGVGPAAQDTSIIGNIASEAKAGLTGIKDAFTTPSVDVPIESIAGDFGGALPVSGETMKVPNPAAAIPAAAQVAFSPVTGAGAAIEKKMVQAWPSTGVPRPAPEEGSTIQQAVDAAEGFPDFTGVSQAGAARFVAENAILFPAALKIAKVLGVTGKSAMEMAKANYTRSGELANLGDDAILNSMKAPEYGATLPEAGKDLATPELRQAEIDRLLPEKASMEEIVAKAGKNRQEMIDSAGQPVAEPDISGTTPMANPETGANQASVQGFEDRSYPPFPDPKLQSPAAAEAAGEKLTPAPMEQIVSAADREKQALIDAEWLPGPEGISKMYGGGPDTGDVMKKYWARTKPLPAQDEIRSTMQGFLDRGMTPKQALTQMGHDTGRHPMEIFDHLNATPSKANTEMALEALSRGETLDDTMPPDVKAMMWELAGREPRKVTGIDPPMPRNLQSHYIDPAIPDLSKDIGSVSRNWASNNIISARHFGTTNNPINDAFSGQLGFADNALRDKMWQKNMIAELGGKSMRQDIRASQAALESELGETFDEFVALHKPKVAAQREMEVLKTQLDNTTKGSAPYRKISEEIKRLEDQVQVDIKEPLTKLYAIRDRVLFGDAEAGTTGLAQRYTNMRLKLAATGNKRAEAMLTEPERIVAEKMKTFYKQKKAQLDAKGIPTLEGDYTNFVFNDSMHGEQNAGQFMGPIWYRKGKPTPAVMKFIQRTPGSQDWFPLAFQSLDAYIPSVNRKLAFTPYLQKWAPVVKRWEEGNFPGAAEWLNNFMKQQFNPDAGGSKLINSFIGSQYLMTLFLNASVPVLHLFKALQPFWYRGAWNASKAYYRYGKGFAQIISGVDGPEKQILEAYVHIPALMKNIEQRQGGAGAEWMKPGFWTRMGSSLTAAAEHVGNGISVMSTLEQAAKRGIKDPAILSKNLIHNEMLDTMMRLDGRAMNIPEFLKNHRVIGMYQGQPWKLSENKIDLGRGAFEGMTWENLKEGNIRAMLEGRKDALGDPYMHKFVRMAAILGTVDAAAKHYDINLSKHLFHLPFGLAEIPEAMIQKGMEGGDPGEVLAAGAQAPVQMASPPIQAAMTASDPQKGWLKALEGVGTPVLLNKLSKVGVPQDIVRALTGKELDVPEPSMRYPSANWEFFGVPSVSGTEEARDMRDRKRLMDVYKHPVSTYYKKSPSRRLVEELLGN